MGSDNIVAAINTPKKGFRKWKAADLVAPILFTSKNQIRVPNTPGIRIWYTNEIIKIIDQFINYFSKIIVNGNIKMKPTNICKPKIIIRFLLLLKKFA